jgi:MFS family permease
LRGILPLFTQLALGASATASGLLMLPLMGGLMVSAIASGPFVARTHAYKNVMLVSVAVITFGLWLLSGMDAETSQAGLAWRMLVLGIGLGPSQSLFGLVIQNATPAAQRGVVTSAHQFFRQIGSTIGVALFGTALTGYLSLNLAKVMPGADLNRLRGLRSRSGRQSP